MADTAPVGLDTVDADAEYPLHPSPPVARRSGSGGVWRFSALYLWAIFLVVFGITQFQLYFTVSTFQIIFSQGAVTAVLALAFLIPLTTDTFDLTVGSMMSLTIVLVNWLMINTSLPFGVIVLLVILISACVGVLTGFLVVKLRVNSLIATLGMSQVLSAAQLYISKNRQLSADFSSFIVSLGNGKFLGIPYLDFCLLAIALVIWFVLEQTPLGRRMFAVGGNREAARLAGVSVDRIVWCSLIASAVVASLAGLMYTAQVGAYISDVGQGYLFPALAAVFFGASQLSQRANVWGTLIAFFALAFGIQGVTLSFGVGAFWVSPLFQGAALIGAVALASRAGTLGSAGGSMSIRRLVRLRRADMSKADVSVGDAKRAP